MEDFVTREACLELKRRAEEILHEFDPDRRSDPDEPSNGERANHARKALDAFLRSTGEARRVDEEAVRDLIADLLHLCDREGLSGRAALLGARSNWLLER